MKPDPSSTTIEGPAPAAAPAAGAPGPAAWLPADLGPLLPELAGHRYQAEAQSLIDAPAGWRLVGATRRGWHHEKDGVFREDAYAIAADGAVAVACVADGLGSCPLSRIGSELASRESASRLLATFRAAVESGRDDALASAPLREGIVAALEAVSKRFYDLARLTGRSFKEFRSTLLVTALIERPPVSLLACTQIGDGALVLVRRDGAVIMPGAADSGDVGGMVTKCLPDADDVAAGVREHFVLLPAADLAAVVMYTDGVEIPFAFRPELVVRQLCHGVTEPSPGFKAQATQPGILADPAPAEALQRWLGFEKRGAGDDRTVVIAHRPGVVPARETLHRNR